MLAENLQTAESRASLEHKDVYACGEEARRARSSKGRLRVKKATFAATSEMRLQL